MENVISLLTIMPSTKLEIKSFFEKTKKMILSGETCPLKIKNQIKCIESLIKMINLDEEIEENELNEAEKYGKSFDRYGSNFSIREISVKYDFSICNDEKYNELIKKQEELDKQIKERESFLKILKEQVADVDTGVIIYPAIKTSKTKVFCEIK